MMSFVLQIDLAAPPTHNAMKLLVYGDFDEVLPVGQLWCLVFWSFLWWLFLEV